MSRPLPAQELSAAEGRALTERYPFVWCVPTCGDVARTGTRATGLYRFTCNRPALHTGPHLAYAPGPIVVATWENTP
jgi:hypothetical protein